MPEILYVVEKLSAFLNCIVVSFLTTIRKPVEASFYIIVTVLSPGTKTSIFGLYPTLLRNKGFEQTNSVDFAVVGEPEWAYVKLVKSLKGEISFDSVSGIFYKTPDGVVSQNSFQNFSDNELDELAFPSRDLLKNEKYQYP